RGHAHHPRPGRDSGGRTASVPERRSSRSPRARSAEASGTSECPQTRRGRHALPDSKRRGRRKCGGCRRKANTQEGEVMAYEKIVAVYDKAGKAKEAARALEASGFAAGDISVLNRDSLTDAEVHEAGLWRRLFGRNVGDHESAVYGRTIESGRAVLTLRTAHTEVPRAMKILDVHNPVDVNERATALGVSTPATRTAVPQQQPAASARLTKEEVLRLAEEQLEVGKRQVETGRARIRRFVTERP